MPEEGRRADGRGRPIVHDNRSVMNGDRAYDSDPLDQKLAEQGIEMIASHKRNRVRPSTQDGRKLRCYSRRWKVERTFAWLNKFRRLDPLGI